MTGQRVLVGVPVKNASKWIMAWWDKFKQLTYPKDLIRIVFIYAKSEDSTLQLLKEIRDSYIIDVEIYNENYDNLKRLYGIQMGESIYKDFQTALADGDEDYFMLMDCDLVDFPKDLIEQLMSVNADVVAPYPYCKTKDGKEFFFDTWIFRVNNIRFDRDDPPEKDSTYPVEVDTVGTCFLAKREAFLNTEIRNPYPNLTFCLNVKRNGGKVVACPYIKVYHINLEEMGILHFPADQSFGGYPEGGVLTSIFRLKKYKKAKGELI